jgi:hypothetical protein
MLSSTLVISIVLSTQFGLITSLVVAPSLSHLNTLSTTTSSTTTTASNQITNPFQRQGLNIDLPDFDEIFQKISQASPLAKSVLNGINGQRGFNAVSKSM